jgi:hypothetical protein
MNPDFHPSQLLPQVIPADLENGYRWLLCFDDATNRNVIQAMLEDPCIKNRCHVIITAQEEEAWADLPLEHLHPVEVAESSGSEAELGTRIPKIISKIQQNASAISRRRTIIIRAKQILGLTRDDEESFATFLNQQAIRYREENELVKSLARTRRLLGFQMRLGCPPFGPLRYPLGSRKPYAP